jgi:hypothetical protein
LLVPIGARKYSEYWEASAEVDLLDLVADLEGGRAGLPVAVDLVGQLEVSDRSLRAVAPGVVLEFVGRRELLHFQRAGAVILNLVAVGIEDLDTLVQLDGLAGCVVDHVAGFDINHVVLGKTAFDGAERILKGRLVIVIVRGV